MVFALGNQFLSAFARYAGEKVGWTATNLLRRDLARHCLRLDMGFQKTRTPGEMIERIDGDCSTLSNFFSQFVVGLVGNGLLLIGVLVLLFGIDVRVGLGVSAFAIAALVLMFRLRSEASPHWAAVRQVSAEFYGFLGERLSGTEDIRANGAAAYVMRRFHEIVGRWLGLQRKASLWGYAMWQTNIIVFAPGTAVAFALSAYLWSRGEITIGTAYLIFNYTELIRRPLDQIRTQMQDLQRAAAGISRIQGLLDTKPSIEDGPGGGGPPRTAPPAPAAVAVVGRSSRRARCPSTSGRCPSATKPRRTPFSPSLTSDSNPGASWGSSGARAVARPPWPGSSSGSTTRRGARSASAAGPCARRG